MRPFVADKGILMDNEVSLVRGSESEAAGGEGRVFFLFKKQKTVSRLKPITAHF